MKVEKIDHVHIIVKDLDKAASLFGKLFETEFRDLGVSEEHGVRSFVSPIGLTLVTPSGPETPLARYIEQNGEGIHSIAFRVDDLEQATSEMTAQKIREVGRLQHAEYKGVQFHPKDAHGVLIELEQIDSG